MSDPNQPPGQPPPPPPPPPGAGGGQPPPGWWQASDGNWYPPQAQPGQPQPQPPPQPPPPPGFGGPPPPPKGGKGCLIFGLVALVVLIGLGVVVAVALIASDDDDDAATRDTTAQDAGDSGNDPLTSSDNDENPPPDDVEITACEVDDVINSATAELEVVNNSSEPSNYVITVEFLTPDGTRIGEGVATTTGLRPDQRARLEAFGPGVDDPDVECRVGEVERFAA